MVLDLAAESRRLRGISELPRDVEAAPEPSPFVHDHQQPIGDGERYFITGCCAVAFIVGLGLVIVAAFTK